MSQVELDPAVETSEPAVCPMGHSEAPTCPAGYNPTDPLFDDDPVGYFHQIQEQSDEAGMLAWPEGGGWIASSYEAVHTALLHPDLSSSLLHHPLLGGMMVAGSDDPFIRLLAASLFGAGNEDHRRIRKAVSRSFTKRAIAPWAGPVASLANRRFDEVIGSAASGQVIEIDWLGKISNVLPHRIIASFYGIPPDRLDEYTNVSIHLGGLINPALTPEDLDLAIAAATSFTDLASDLIGQCEPARFNGQAGTGSLFSMLAGYIEDGDLSTDEAIAMAAALLIGGTETSAHMLSKLVMRMSSQPAEVEALAEPGDNGRIAERFVGETLRAMPISKQTIARYALRDTTICGVEIAKGDAVVALTSGANVDARTFPDPRSFDLDRDNLASSLIFGKGAHRCLGADIAVLEGRVFAEVTARRLTDIHVTDLAWSGHAVFHSASRLSVSATVR